jgi:hypothetical protein
VTYPGFTPVGNATLVVANVLTCNKHSQKFMCCCPQVRSLRMPSDVIRDVLEGVLLVMGQVS